MSHCRLVFAVFCLSLVTSFGFAKGKLEFTVDLRDTRSHMVHVSFTPSGFHAKTAVYQMPIWAPGAYSVTGYGRYVQNFKAFDKKGDLLAKKQVNENRWQIAKGNSVARIEYDVIDSHLDTTSLYFAMANIDSSLFFANATALFGYYDDDKKAGTEVSYMIPDDWKLLCALPPPAGYVNDTNASFKNTMFVAKDYDELADAPILAAPERKDGNHLDRVATKSFLEDGVVYDVAVATDGSWSDAKMDSLAECLRKIVHAETDFFHDVPYKHYTFEIVAPTLSHVPGFAEGALEHANSSDYLLIDFGWSMFKSNFLSIFSHEFFHLWNVKRIHSNLLGPFDYTERVMTKSLWVAEGITEYYAHTLLSRYGMITPTRFFNDVKQWRTQMGMAPASANVKTLEDLSIDESTFEMDEATLFYTRGPLVALMLDIEIRSRTNNKRSLDDVMLALNNDAKHGKTFREDELIHKVEKYAGIDLTDFYNKYIHGTDSLPLDEYLGKMGYLENPTEEPSQATSHKEELEPYDDSTYIVKLLDTTSALAMAGVKEGDLIEKMNDKRISRSNIMELYVTDDDIRLTLNRQGQHLEVVVKQNSRSTHNSTNRAPTHQTPSNMNPNATPLATAIRQGIVGG